MASGIEWKGQKGVIFYKKDLENTIRIYLQEVT